MKLLFDQNVPRNLRQHMIGHEVPTAADMRWGRIENGELIKRAEDASFNVFVTCDQNIAYQQNLNKRRIAIVELTKNNWPSVEPRISEIVKAIQNSATGMYSKVVCEYVFKARRRVPGAKR